MSNYHKIKIIGIGNLLLMDEGIGIHVINELVQYKLPEYIELHDGGTGGFKLLELMCEADKIIFIDAVDNGKKPGSVICIKAESVCSAYRKNKYSLHDMDLIEVLKIATLLGNLPEIKIIGIQPKTIKHGIELSMELRESMPEIIKKVLNEFRYNSI